ncbi:MAG: cation:proton antiporter, partial [Dehalococcoidales bacterium]|nr:cation:proton antiporter [Dehalococcoidales bacterium]
LGWGVGLSLTGAVFFGFIIAMSSTMVVLKLLMDRGEMDTVYGRIMLGILLIQDLSVVPLMALLPALGGDEETLGITLGIALAKAIGFVALMLTVGYWGMPWLMKRVAGQRNRELFLLTVVVVCLGAAFGTYYFGLSAALGAFAAGLLISQSGYARQAFADIMPLRDAFGALFFVSLGMLANLGFIHDNWITLIVVVVAVMLVKFIIASLVVRLFGYGHRTVLMVGTGLVQIGEFSFVLALMGWREGIFPEHLYNLTIASAIVTMLLTPFFMGLNSRIYRWLSQRRWFARRFIVDDEVNLKGTEAISRHAVICGYGTVGRRIAGVLDRLKFPYLVIELEPNAIAELRQRGIPCIYGDASNPEILAHAELDKARVLICTMPDCLATELAIRHARRINPKIDVVARVHRDSDVELLKGLGVTEIVLPFFEGSLEMIRHTLHRFGLTTTEIQYILNSLRQSELKRQD